MTEQELAVAEQWLAEMDVKTEGGCELCGGDEHRFAENGDELADSDGEELVSWYSVTHASACPFVLVESLLAEVRRLQGELKEARSTIAVYESASDDARFDAW